ncbi:Histone deacetylase 3 [Astathelohania contejeani]|uniref:histone deacetylase n=1 Tax=Astathelohania contejeani TaxID=164912 RepID=A0ABQ7HZG6_9MICR|nr:Histone deacetylase 3 [Thelohania contejeani]
MKIAYIFDEEAGKFHYGEGHPMKPHRITLTHSLVKSYGLDKHMCIIKPTIYPISKWEGVIPNYHSKEYLENLDNMEESKDCPCFPGITEFCERSVSGSFTAARLLTTGQYDVAINWSGGLHHAKRKSPSGFCYTNDIVIAILELLNKYDRIIYIDIDIHHGDGVEEAFYDCDRVLTLSFHKYGDYFPGTGSIVSNGGPSARGCAVNVPLLAGADDSSYRYIFEPVVKACVDSFSPQIIVMQCGADSIGEDRIGCFNLSIHGHGECVRFVRSLGLPMLVLGGGGYNAKNVCKAWANETAIMAGIEIPNEIPIDNPYYEYFKPDCILHPDLRVKYENLNTKEYLDVVKGYVFESLGILKRGET